MLPGFGRIEVGILALSHIEKRMSTYENEL